MKNKLVTALAFLAICFSLNAFAESCKHNTASTMNVQQKQPSLKGCQDGC